MSRKWGQEQQLKVTVVAMKKRETEEKEMLEVKDI
jgi:hypothetical protein